MPKHRKTRKSLPRYMRRDIEKLPKGQLPVNYDKLSQHFSVIPDEFKVYRATEEVCISCGVHFVVTAQTKQYYYENCMDERLEAAQPVPKLSTAMVGDQASPAPALQHLFTNAFVS